MPDPGNVEVWWKIMPLAELSEWMDESESNRQRDIEQLLESDPEFFQKMDELIEKTWPERKDLEAAEVGDPHSVRWHPFGGEGRYSADGKWHIAWGTDGGGNKRIGISCEHELRLWLKPVAHVGQAWVSDTGGFLLKFIVGEDDLVLVVGDHQGRQLSVWRRGWRFFRLLRFDHDGLGFAFEDRDGCFETRLPSM